MDWNITPGTGVGPLRFGMTPTEVEKILGPVEKKRIWANMFKDNPEMAAQYGDAVTEYRIFGDADTMMPTTSYLHDRLRSIDFTDAHKTLTLGELNLITDDRNTIIYRLCEIDKDAFRTTGGYIFRGLGLSLNGEDYLDENEGVNVFTPGDMDDFIRREGLPRMTDRPRL